MIYWQLATQAFLTAQVVNDDCHDAHRYSPRSGQGERERTNLSLSIQYEADVRISGASIFALDRLYGGRCLLTDETDAA